MHQPKTVLSRSSEANPGHASDLYVRRTHAPKNLADRAVAELNGVLTASGRGSGQDLVAAVAGSWQFTRESGVKKNRMILTFRHDMTAAQTRIFEGEHEEPLRYQDEGKNDLLARGLAVWLYVDGTLAGESFGAIVEDRLRDEDTSKYERSDLDWLKDVQRYPHSVYCNSTTILTKFQHQGLGKILKGYWLGYVWAKCPGRTITGHATSEGMVKINRLFGARFLGSHEKWFGTDRVAHFYEIVAPAFGA